MSFAAVDGSPFALIVEDNDDRPLINHSASLRLGTIRMQFCYIVQTVMSTRGDSTCWRRCRRAGVAQNRNRALSFTSHHGNLLSSIDFEGSHPSGSLSSSDLTRWQFKAGSLFPVTYHLKRQVPQCLVHMFVDCTTYRSAPLPTPVGS